MQDPRLLRQECNRDWFTDFSRPLGIVPIWFLLGPTHSLLEPGEQTSIRFEASSSGIQRCATNGFRTNHHQKRVLVRCYSSRDLVWATSWDELLERVKQKIGIEYCLIFLFWSANEIHCLIDVPKGMMDNIAFFCDEVLLSLIAKIISHGHQKTLKRFMIHMDNVHSYNLRQFQECHIATKTQRLSHSTSRPDSFPSYFFLFGDIKRKLTHFDCITRKDLKSVIITIFNEIDKEILITVFRSSMERFQWVIKNKGWYYHV
jgi:hypothetical protein